MAKVDIISYTGHETSPLYAARLLAYTKNTRLSLTPGGWEEWATKPEAEILAELEYMAGTIASSWEFVDVTFSLQDVSRACAQQITRTRTASYAMQSQRVTDMSGVTVHIPLTVVDREAYEVAIQTSLDNYSNSVMYGESLEDARGLLPMNVHCNLVAKYNLRSLVELLRGRDSLRVQGEYHDIALQMKAAVLEIWPWSATFFVPKDRKSIEMIEAVARELEDRPALRARLAKAADLLKK